MHAIENRPDLLFGRGGGCGCGSPPPLLSRKPRAGRWGSVPPFLLLLRRGARSTRGSQGTGGQADLRHTSRTRTASLPSRTRRKGGKSIWGLMTQRRQMYR
ncbi:uncharacterized protein LOC123409777 isoform X2 [Hordeum vulgare subsp. vulgare]|uniref:uncharacterized protein LOC123409777 isoform X2 n=1 Tax=Hordeum vulgare subsp. vulgare TaxID=112509 RepID=UPI001D1A4687|nr:uncharacterized protein LOC123409777 isoform X2 [Hordeum vulgare subsp. vulgare]XP_044958602.1 uncharacterized protein LOC123409777 isoform X2 [Hordeum vulgare subsp. vulgare]